MLRKILLALIKNDREQLFVMVIDYVLKENRVLRDKYAGTGKRLLLNDEQRRELAILFPDERMNGDPNGKILKHSRLGGLLNFYHRAPPAPDADSYSEAKAAA